MLALAAITAVMALQMNVIGNDFSVFWRAARSATPYLPGDSNSLPYPPPTLLWLQPLAYIGAWPGYFLWCAVWLAGFAALTFRLDGARTAILATLSPASIYCIAMGQMSGFVAILILVGVLARRGIWFGVALGLAATIKPQMLLLAPLVLIARKDLPAIAAAAVTAAMVVSVATIVFGLQSWLDWQAMMHEWRNLVRAVGANAPAASPALFAEYLGWPTIPFLIAGVACGIWLALSSKDAEPIELAGIIVLSSVLASPYSMGYDLIAAMPLAASRAFQRKAYLFLLFLPAGIIASAWVAIITARRHQDRDRCTPAIMPPGASPSGGN